MPVKGRTGRRLCEGAGCPGPGAIGPAGPLHLTWRHPAASYVALAAATAGNGWELFAVVAFIYAACFLVAGWRHARRHGPGRGR